MPQHTNLTSLRSTSLTQGMISVLTKRVDWRIRYQCGLAVFSVLIFFTNLDVYCDSAGILPLAPLHWIVLFGLASLPLMSSFSSRKDALPRGVLIWCAGYFLLTLISFWFFSSVLKDSPGSFQELRDRTLSVCYIILSLLIYSKYSIVLTWTRSAFIAAGLMGTLNNIYEFFNPLVFSGLNQTGRPAGFYVNSNNCGCALMEAMIIGIGLLRPVYRLPYAFVMGVGVFLTFSRAALIAWFLVMAILLVMGIVPYRQLLRSGIGVVIAITALVTIGSSFIDIDQLADAGLINKNVLERLSQTEGTADVKDDSTLARLAVAKMAWDMFDESPIIGNGVGSVLALDVGELVEHPISTHNQYLYFLADHGVLGLLIYPLLVLSILYPFNRKHRSMNVSLAVFCILWGFFSHTVILLRLHLTIFAFVATLNNNKSQPLKP
jgi:O-antigen ligase